MDNNEIETLSKYRLEQAKENLKEAEVLMEAKMFKGANNRAYYAIFHAIKAILALEEVDFKKHSSVIAYFNKNYINKGVFSKQLGKKLTNATIFREKSDYVDFYIVTKEESEEQIETAREIIDLVEKYLRK